MRKSRRKSMKVFPADCFGEIGYVSWSVDVTPPDNKAFRGSSDDHPRNYLGELEMRMALHDGDRTLKLVGSTWGDNRDDVAKIRQAISITMTEMQRFLDAITVMDERLTTEQAKRKEAHARRT